MIYLFRQVCAGLAEAHGLGLVHRDLKPANVFVAVRGGESDVSKVLDFGLVKLTRDPDAANLTSDMTVSGTPMFMAPEQTVGDRSLDARADIYALGAMMYHALTGQPPFAGENAFAIMMAHSRDPVVPPSQLNPDVPADLEQVVLRCLAKKPEDRYPSARRWARPWPPAPRPPNGAPTGPRPGGPPRGWSSGRMQHYLRRSSLLARRRLEHGTICSSRPLAWSGESLTYGERTSMFNANALAGSAPRSAFLTVAGVPLPASSGWIGRPAGPICAKRRARTPHSKQPPQRPRQRPPRLVAIAAPQSQEEREIRAFDDLYVRDFNGGEHQGPGRSVHGRCRGDRGGWSSLRGPRR